MRTKDGSRRRTPGGVFFQLVKERVTAHERRRLFPYPAPRPGQGQPQSQPPGQATALTWDEVEIITQTLAAHPAGEARTMKVTLIGRPGRVETRGQAVIFRIQGKPPGALPRGLPPVPAQAPLTWTVMVALRQWNRVKESLAANQDDQLITDYRGLSPHAGQPAHGAGAKLRQYAATAGTEAGAATASGAGLMTGHPPTNTVAQATVADVQRQIRESLGLPPVPEAKPTMPVEGHVCEFPLWSFSKQRSAEKQLHIAYDDGSFLTRDPERDAWAKISWLSRYHLVLWTARFAPARSHVAKRV
jgi:hypothetical protein